MIVDRATFLKLTAAATVGQVPAQLRTIRVISIPTDAAKEVLYAEKGGIFRKHGLDAQISAMGSGAAIFAAVVGGSADFGSGSLYPAFQAFGHGIPLRIVAPIAIYDTNHCDTWLLVAKNSPLHAPRDLQGKIMGADAPNDIYVSAVRMWMTQHGADSNSIRAIELKATEQVAALDQGRIDMVVLKPPYLTVALQSGKVRVLGKPLDVIGPRFLLSCWISTVDFIAKNPDVLNAFAQSLRESAHYCDTHEPETIPLVAAFSGQDPTLLAQGVRSVLPERITLADVQKPLDFAFKVGALDRQYDAKTMLAASVSLSAA